MTAMFDDADTVLETHISWVYLVGDRAYKRKKPVRTPFLDYTSPERRAEACAEEVRLGRRLAPDVYLGVDALPGDDWAVVMRRMPLDRRLSSLVRSGQDVSAAIREIARRVAALHLRSGRLPAADEAASPEATLHRWEANHAELQRLADRLADPNAPAGALKLARHYVAGRGALFAARVAAGRAVDGHGDLLADDIFVLPDGPRILDPIEFDPRLRYGDGLADVAFLAMHLEWMGGGRWADELLARYAEFAADHWPASLAHFHIAYRAQVRAKVACLAAAQQGVGRAPDADAFLALALAHLDAAGPRLVLVGGAPATGKTTLSRWLGDARGWVVLRSDDVRKELAGIPATASAAAPLMAGVYTPAMTALAYGELVHRAQRLLEHGESVVLDATWGDAMWRQEARRVAAATCSDLLELRCALPVEVAARRAAERRPGESDAGPEVALELASRFGDWPEAVPVDTGGSPEDCFRAAAAAVDGSTRRPAAAGVN
jgi:aminoglycoside phosphotransferase family enzyme/predicted kinase